jgi:hypothetical protein
MKCSFRVWKKVQNRYVPDVGSSIKDVENTREFSCHFIFIFFVTLQFVAQNLFAVYSIRICHDKGLRRTRYFHKLYWKTYENKLKFFYENCLHKF